MSSNFQPNIQELISQSTINEKDSSYDVTSADKSKLLSMLTQNAIKINEKFITKFTKGIKNLKKEAKEACKVLHFQSDWTFEVFIAELAILNPEEYPNLFIFIIEVENFTFDAEKVLKIQESLLKFSTSRPLVLQLTSDDSTFYYKNESSTQFSTVDQQETFEELKNFPSFFGSFLDETLGHPEDFEIQIIEMLPQLNDSTLILRFLKTLDLSDEFHGSIILKVSENGTKSDFLAALDAQFDFDGRMLSTRAQTYLSDIFYEDQSDDESADESEQAPDHEEASTERENQDSASETSSTSSNSHLSPSVMLIAVEHKNKEVIDYLITFWTHLIQQLPFKHRVRISTVALESSQLDVLCDLLEISDFPFPENFQVESVEHVKLIKITAERTQFSTWIKDENFEKIDEFIDSNLNLKIIYNPENKSAMKQAVNLKKFNIYWHLKSFGFKATEFANLEEILSGKELKQAILAKVQQRRKNVNESLTDDDKSVNLLCNRSSIHNKRIKKEQEAEYRKKIRNWFNDIKKIKFGTEFLNVAASCEKLRIIFDFESNTVENASLSGPHSLGSTYPNNKWIFIGAKLLDNKREQRIKGVLAHELCHYDMRLVFENQENPYYKHMLKIAEMFEEIVKIIDKWSIEGAECPDDECNRIISSVFKMYSKDEFHLELIVRVVQILVEFDDDQDKVEYLEDKYKQLFDFWEHQVIPELRKFNLKDREVVRKMNRLFDLLPGIKNQKIEFRESKDIKDLIHNNLMIVTSNVPLLLLINMQQHLKQELGDLFDTNNVFVDPKKLKNQEISSDFERLLDEDLKLRFIVDCSKEVPQDLDQYDVNKESRLVFVAQNQKDCENLEKSIKKCGDNPEKLDINFTWTDLTEESQKLMLQTKVNFQNNSSLSLLDLLSKEVNLTENSAPEALNDQIASIIDAQLLNLLVNKSEIKINQQNGDENDDKIFKILFKSRTLIKSFKIQDGKDSMNDGHAQCQQEMNTENVNAGESSPGISKEDLNFKEMDKTEEVTQEQMLEDVKNNKFVLISDKAGSGKSWILKNCAISLQFKYPTNWVTYVDLKQFITEFKAQRSMPEFSAFFIDKILKPKFNFEVKIFKNCYKNGKTTILFDGFDEIAPDCAEFVSNLAHSFEFNDGNQLWIATRDYFEVDLKKKLELDKSYMLSEFTTQDGVDLIVSSWMLSKMKGKADSNDLKKSEKYELSLNYAKTLSQWIFKLKTQPIGLPQFYRMIAEVFYKTEKTMTVITILYVYSKFVWIHYERWAYKKGELRKNESIAQQKKALNYHQLHQLIAMHSLFPEISRFCDLDIKKLDWMDEEIIACGMLIKKGGKFFFFHETFREYFAAEFFIRILTHGVVDFCRLLIPILSSKNFQIIRIFLDQFLSEDSLWMKIDSNVQKLAVYFCECSNSVYFHHLFCEDLGNLTDLVIVVLKIGTYENVKIILKGYFYCLLWFEQSSSTFFNKIQDFIISYLNAIDLKLIVLQTNILQIIFGTHLEINSIERFLNNLCDKTDQNFISKALKAKDKNNLNVLLFNCIDSSSVNADKFRAIIQILSKYLNHKDIINLIKSSNYFGRNILHECVDKGLTNKLKFVWIELNKLFGSESSTHFKDMLLTNYRIFTYALNKDLQLYTTFWDLLLDTFEDQNIVKHMIMLKDTNDSNLIHLTIKKSDKIELTLRRFKDYFNEAQFHSILITKGNLEANLLLLAAKHVKIIEIFKFLWNLVCETFKSDEDFKKFLMQCDFYSDNFIHYVVKHSNVDIFEFIIEQFERLSSQEDIQKLLKLPGKANYSLLQSAAEHNLSLDLHKRLWTLIEKYFNPQEFLAMIKHTNWLGEHVMFSLVSNNHPEVAEFTWNQIKKYICTKDDQAKFLKKRGFVFTTLKFQVNSLMNSKPKAHEWFNNLIKEFE